MNILPRNWFAGSKSNAIGSSAIVRAGMALGPFQPIVGAFIPREVNPWFLEGLRSSLGILDGAINRLVTVDGIIDVEGGNDALVQEIQRELIASIPVGDMQAGLQAFYAAQGNEMYEQGFSIGEQVFDRRGRELVALRVADSKGVLFHRDPASGVMQTWYLPPFPNVFGRRDGTDAVETVLRNTPRQLNVQLLQGHGYVELNSDRLNYCAFNHENDMPYGVSLFRGIEFVSQIMLKMHNATGQAWDRFGDPIFHINYKTKNRALKDGALESRRSKLAADLSAALMAKRGGNSADFTTAVGADDEITVTIVGGDGKVLAIEMPAKQMMEQILAKTGLPAWMLGITGGTAERMADNQAEVVLQESKTRFESRLPGLDKLVATWLRGRGRTWKPGDWKLVQRLPNLRDELKRAQAGFLNAQTQLMMANGGAVAAPSDANPQSDDPTQAAGKAALLDLLDDNDPVLRAALRGLLSRKAAAPARCQHKDAGNAPAEPWAVDDPNLPRIEGTAISLLGSAWNQLREDTLSALGLAGKSAKAPGDAAFMYDASTLFSRLQELLQAFIVANSSKDSAFVAQVVEAWMRGVENAAASIDRTAEAEQVVAAARERATGGIAERIAAQFQTTALAAYADDIVAELKRGAYDGKNPTEVAASLRKRFKAHDYDWERLARSEIAQSQAEGQLQGFASMGYAWYDFDANPDACPICLGLQEAGPYRIGDASSPVPMKDSHPNCRCAVAASDGPPNADPVE